MENGLDLGSALALQRNGEGNDGDGMGGMNWIWIIVIFLLVGGGGLGGFGGRGATENQISNDFLFTNLNNSLGQGFTQLANGQVGLQKDLCQGFSGVQMGMSNLQHSQDMCCCEINRNIDSAKCDIITAGNANTQRIVDTITQNEIQALRDQLQSAQLTLANSAQTSTIINSVRPFPSPSYITCSPYTSANNIGCGFGGSFGCGC